MPDPQPSSRIVTSIDLRKHGRQVGDLKVKWSDNRQPVGYYPVPVFCLANGDGPTLLLTGGVHGDEFEGPAALMRLAQSLSPEEINGRVIIVPALNAPALVDSSRVSPIDGLNLNRAFPGSADGSPTQMIAHYLETVLLPQCDAAIDLHSGGKAAVFAPCVLAELDPSTPQGADNLALAQAFAAPYLWVSGANNDNRSLNAAASRQRVTMIAAELGGGGGCDPQMVDFTEAALLRCLRHLGIIDSSSSDNPAPASAPVTLSETFAAPARGLFDRRFGIGDRVAAGQHAGWLHFVGEPERASQQLTFATAGIVLACTNRGMVERGDMLALVATPCEIGE